MKRLLPILTLLTLGLSSHLQAQNLELFFSNSLKFAIGPSDTLKFPFTGGFVSPQFNEMDLNLDGVMDMVVFDRSGGRISTYLNKGTANQIDYIYAPQYEEFFPRMNSWLLTRDYNCDGKLDLFTCGNVSGVKVFKNISANGNLAFEHITESIFDLDNQPLYALNQDIPAIEDVDGDGDLDFLSFGVLGGYVSMYRNERVEKSNSCDSLVFKYVDGCWGSFVEAGFTNDVFLGDNCFEQKYYKGAVHAGSTLLMFDNDADGDLEMLLGDVDFPEFKLLRNGKKESNWTWDTIISSKTGFPNSMPVYIDKFPAGFYLDVNNDGKKDLLASANDELSSSNLFQNWVYTNSGANNKPVFNFLDSGFLQSETIDFGSMSKVAFFDADGDGDLDLVMSHRGNFRETKNTVDRLVLFERKGSGSSVHFVLKNEDYLDLAKDSLQGLHPAFGDLNADGKPDLLLGVRDGSIRYYNNTGTLAAPAFTLQNDTLGSIDAGSFSTPALVDMDNDKDLDLLVGHNGGTIKYYVNQGDSLTPNFLKTSLTDSLGRILVNNFYWQYEYDQVTFEIIDSSRLFEFEGFSVPYVADMDNDGNPELLVGSKKGEVNIYQMLKNTPGDSFPEYKDYLVWPRTGRKGSFYFGARTTPAATDVNGDGKPELFVGNSRGGIHFLASVQGKLDSLITSAPVFAKELDLQLYPNPTQNDAKLQLSELASSDILVELADVQGRVLYSGTWEMAKARNEYLLPTSALKPGSYFIRLSGGMNASRVLIKLD